MNTHITRAPQLKALDAVPRIGWVRGPTPVVELPRLARQAGLGSLWVKRDDLCQSLHGGTKVRKLDYLLADPNFSDATGWVSVGSIGSGHLSTLASAAIELGRGLEVVAFWQEPTQRVLEDLAFTASVAQRFRFQPSRIHLALRHPNLLLRGRHRRLAVVPPGATCPVGMVGMVQAGLELSLQVADGHLPAPDRIVVPLGTGGTVVGLALGLALGGVRTQLHAVCAVERPLSSRWRIEMLYSSLCRWLSKRGVRGLEGLDVLPIRLDRSQIGHRYGDVTARARAAVKRLAFHELALEPTYSGRSMACLLAGRPAPRENVLFWHTPRHEGPLHSSDGWRDRLPRALANRLPASNTPSERRDRRSKRVNTASAINRRQGSGCLHHLESL